jgi:acyl carrier protein
MASIEDKVMDIVAEQLGVDREKISMQVKLRE